MNQATVRGVHAAAIPEVWSRVEPILSRAVLKHTDERPNDIMLDIMCERVQLWSINDFEAVCLTQIHVRPTVKVLWIYYVAGEGMSSWLGELVRTLSAFADEKGCKRLEFTGRQGWEKVLKEHGFGAKLITMRLDLSEQKNKSTGPNILALAASTAISD